MREKYSLILVFCFICVIVGGCSFFHSNGSTRKQSDNDPVWQQRSKDYGEPKRIATVQDNAVTESSGLAASRKNKDVFWTHNDSGGGAFIYAFDRAGNRRGTFQVTDSKNRDWEDMALYTDAKTGESYLLLGDIGDIGDNERRRQEITVYRVKEPDLKPEDANSSKNNPRATEKAEAIRLKYPDGANNAETMMVNPSNGDLYILSKTFDGDAGVYKLAAPFQEGQTYTMRKVGTISVPNLPPGLLTAGDISPDGRRVVISDYFAAYEMVLPAGAKNFDDIWKQKPSSIKLGEREQGETICYRADGRAIFATSEKKNPPLIEVERK